MLDGVNLHHVELFYYVARHGGVVAACRHIPYGIQQPAVSAQLIQLEEDLGTRLFQRRPFVLTPAGKELYDFCAPFFSQIGDMEARLRGRLARTVRLAGLSEVMRDHVPAVMATMKKRIPGLRVTLQEASHERACTLILHGDADLAITVVEEKMPSPIKARTLLRLPLILLVPSRWRCLGEAEIIERGCRGEIDLISLPPQELLPRLFAEGLRKKRRVWPIALEVSSVELVLRYVREGLGVGISAASPTLELPRGVRAVPLSGMPQLGIGAFWTGKLPELPQAFLDELILRAEATGTLRKSTS